MLKAPRSKAILVLLAEDEALVRELVAEALTDGGFEVVEAANGAQAVALIEKDPDALQAVVADIRLGPGLDGWAVARRACALHPHLPVVYMSGDSVADWRAQGVPNSVVLQKPFAPAKLVAAVASLIGHRAA